MTVIPAMQEEKIGGIILQSQSWVKSSNPFWKITDQKWAGNMALVEEWWLSKEENSWKQTSWDFGKKDTEEKWSMNKVFIYMEHIIFYLVFWKQ
jgi:hypothetical protein